MPFSATTITITGTTPVLIVPGSPVPGWARQAIVQNVSAAPVQLYLGGTSITGSNGFPLTGTAIFSVEAHRQQDLYCAGAANGLTQNLTILMDLI